MIKYIWRLILLVVSPVCLQAQIFPKEGSSLHYRIIGFTFSALPDAKEYKLEIARGNYYKEDSFRRNIILTAAANKTSIIAEVPSFGASFTWRILYCNETGVWTSTSLYHFSTGIVPAADTATVRLRILQHARKFKDSYVFLDGNKTLYDMSGKPVWYLPAIGGSESKSVRDLKLSRMGTITFMAGTNTCEQIYEIDYNGNILWKGPNDGKVSGGSGEYYHHQFSRLSNGHYMVMGTEMLFSEIDPSRKNQTSAFVRENEKKPGRPYADAQMPTLIEYDEIGNVVWSWKSADYFLHSDVRNRKMPSGPFEDIHGNAFFFDKNKQSIYISFRNISRILKIHYPDGMVMAEYGRIYKPEDTLIKDIRQEQGNGMYCYQHSCIPAGDGTFYVFNNNACNLISSPSVVKLREPGEAEGQLKKVWEYNCSMEPSFINKEFTFGSGGNIARLPDKSLFVNMGGLYSKLFIVTEDKQVLWSALPEQRNKDGKWETVPQYHASIIFRNDLERLIFGNSSGAAYPDRLWITYNSNK